MERGKLESELHVTSNTTFAAISKMNREGSSITPRAIIGAEVKPGDFNELSALNIQNEVNEILLVI